MDFGRLRHLHPQISCIGLDSTTRETREGPNWRLRKSGLMGVVRPIDCNSDLDTTVVLFAGSFTLGWRRAGLYGLTIRSMSIVQN